MQQGLSSSQDVPPPPAAALPCLTAPSSAEVMLTGSAWGVVAEEGVLTGGLGGSAGGVANLDDPAVWDNSERGDDGSCGSATKACGGLT